MKKTFTLIASVFAFTAQVLTAQTPTLVHYWNFNDNSSLTNLLATNVSLVSGASISHIAGGTSTIDLAGGTGQNFNIANVNARQGAPSGTHLRFNNPIGGQLEFALPTTGYENVEVKFATRRSGSGAGLQYWSYSTDNGANYIPFDTIVVVDADPALGTLDFTAINAVDNNAGFKLRVAFDVGAGGSAGNNRFDNFTVDADPLVVVVTPVIQAGPNTLSGYSQVLGTPSAEQLFIVSGFDLTNNIVITTPQNFEISLTSGSGFVSSLSLTPTNSVVPSTTIYARLNATAAGSYSGNISITSTGASSLSINVDGVATAPLTSSILYYWHFNTLSTPNDVTKIDADFTLLPNHTGSFEYTGPIQGERDIDSYSPGTNLNIQMSATIGSAARVRNPSATRSLVFDVPTTGAQNIKMTYAVQRSGSGMLENVIEYSIDGTNFITTGLTNNVQEVVGAETWQIFNFDFSTISQINNNPNFKVKITWIGNNTASNGNNRYDNISFTGDAAPVGINNNISVAKSIKVFPNPFTSTFTIESSEIISQIYLFDISGKLVKEYLQVNASTINLEGISELQNGIYQALIKTDAGYSQARLIKD